uniref:Uncharacterized protein n=1 Tax=Solanum tuberosum TaxID=4113 RepID=M1CPE7_SOLTU
MYKIPNKSSHKTEAGSTETNQLKLRKLDQQHTEHYRKHKLSKQHIEDYRKRKTIEATQRKRKFYLLWSSKQELQRQGFRSLFSGFQFKVKTEGPKDEKVLNSKK